MTKFKLFAFISFLTLFFNIAIFAQTTGSITGQVYDSLGGVLVNATVIAVDAAGKEKSVTTNRQGEFTISGLAPGKYTVRSVAPKFGLYEQADVEVTAGAKQELTIALTVATGTEIVNVNNQNDVSTDVDANKSQVVLSGKDLEGLPENEDELQAALTAMAGAAGPDGASFIIDGSSGGRFPPRESIREIRFNRNPFSAEFDRLGFGRIEILTKPGSDKFRGGANFNFNDESLNARNPFSLNRASSQRKGFGANLSGPIQKGKSSFFVDFNWNDNANASAVAATILDSSLNVTSFNQEFNQPSSRFSISPRIDYAINASNTLVARYSFSNGSSENQGVGGFSLPSRASTSDNYQHEIRLTETAILNPKTVNETRFSYEFNKRNTLGDNSIPTINVSGAFTGGGAQVGTNYNNTTRWELQNFTTTSFGKNNEHSIKVGGTVRGVDIKDRSESNYGGTFLFTGVRDAITGAVILSSIEQYRQKLLGNTNAIYNPNQYTITTGNPVAAVSQYDVGFFMTDDWKARQDLTLSFGLRYENQTNMSDKFNFAPRFGFAWSPGASGARQPKSVIRGGAGIFYNRYSESNVLSTIRSDGVSQFQYTVQDPAILALPIFTLNGVTNVPSAAQIGVLAPNANIVRTTDPNIQAPYTIQTSLSFERSLPKNSSFSLTYAWAKNLHVLRTRNINAPICPPLQITACTKDSPKPFPALGNIYQYESAGKVTTQFMNASFSSRFSQKVSMNINYTWGWNKGDTDGTGRFGGGGSAFPAYSYDLSNEYARTSYDARHRLMVMGSVQLPFRFSLNPFVIISSGTPFNIYTGIDSNFDGLATERPTYAALSARCTALGLTSDFCNITGIANPATTIIPRNLGVGPMSVIANLSLSKTIGFGKSAADSSQGNGQGGGRGGNRGGGGGGQGGGQTMVMMGGGGGGMMGMMQGGGDGRKPYNLTFNINASNLFNTNNKGNPIGNLNSSNFGVSNSSGGSFGFFGRGGGGGGGGARTINLSMRFNW